MAALTSKPVDPKRKVTKKYSDVLYVIKLINSLDFSDRLSKAFSLAVLVEQGSSGAKAAAAEYLEGSRKDDTKARKVAEGFLRALDRDVLTEYNSLIEDLRVTHCAVDKTNQIILKDKDGKYEFTREGNTAFSTDVKTLNKKEVTFEIKTADRSLFAGVNDDAIEYLIDFGFLS